MYNQGYWKRKGVPSPPPDDLFGNHRDRLHKFEYPQNFVYRDWTKEYGPVYGIMEGWTKTWVVSDPKLVHEILVKKFECFHGRKPNPLLGHLDKSERANVLNSRGARWKRLRTITSPGFNMNNLRRIYPTVDDTCQKLMVHIDKAFEEGKTFNIHPYFHELTMDVIMRIAMGQKGSKLFNNPYVEITKNVLLGFGTSKIERVAEVCPIFAWILKPVFLKYTSMIKTPFEVMLQELIAIVLERRALKAAGKVRSDAEHLDFIDIFIDAEDPSVKDGEFDRSGMRVSKKMTVPEIVSNCFILLLTGFDTSANTLGVTCHYLAKHPEIQDKIVEEIEDVLGDEEISFDRMNELRYMDAVMKEALRMFPIAAFVTCRECVQTTDVGDYKFEEGEHVNIDVFSLHYNKEIWGENADEFVPERFFELTPEQQMAYYPFGGGPRTCIGLKLAYTEEKLLLYYMLKKYRLVRTPESENSIKMVGISVQNPESITLKLEKR